MDIYIGRNGKQRGPFSLGQIKRFIAQGKVKSTDTAWHEGLEDWVPLGEITGIGTPTPKVAPFVPRQRVQPRRRTDQYFQSPRRYLVPVVLLVVSSIIFAVAFYITSPRDIPEKVTQQITASGKALTKKRGGETGQMKKTGAGSEQKVRTANKPSEAGNRIGRDASKATLTQIKLIEDLYSNGELKAPYALQRLEDLLELKQSGRFGDNPMVYRRAEKFLEELRSEVALAKKEAERKLSRRRGLSSPNESTPALNQKAQTQTEFAPGDVVSLKGLMGRFDRNGDGTLDAEERRSLQNFLRENRVNSSSKPRPVRNLQEVCGFCSGAKRLTGAQILEGLKGRMRTGIREQLKFDLLGTPVDQSAETIDYLTKGTTEYQWMNLFLRTRSKCIFAGVTVPAQATSYACPVCDSRSQVRDFIQMMQRVASQY